jgi:ketosteroid isomerase-like protein
LFYKIEMDTFGSKLWIVYCKPNVMKSIITALIGILLILIFSNLANAQNPDLTDIKSEIREAVDLEQNAFKEGNCKQVLDLMDDEITFLANGRKVNSKKIIGKFCNSIPRPFKKPISDTLIIYPLTNESGYTIRALVYPKDDKTKMQEYVTKIWKKTNGGWKITHLHSTVKEVAVSK